MWRTDLRQTLNLTHTLTHTLTLTLTLTLCGVQISSLLEIILVRDFRSAKHASTARLIPRRRSIGFMPCVVRVRVRVRGEGEGEGEG